MDMGQSSFLCSLLPANPLCSPPCSPPLLDADSLPAYEVEPEHVDSIVSLFSSPDKDEEQKMEFLKCIAMIFRDATYNDLSQGLDLFCQRYELVENIEVLLEEEPRDQLPTVVQRIAAFAMADMSFVEEVLEGKDRSHIQACFSSVFMLPPKEEMRDLKPYLYFMTMKAVDSMLVALVLNSPASQVSEKMQDIFQMLLTFSTSERASVRERAVGRMRLLSFLLTNYSSLKADPNEDRDDSGAEIQMPILGQLLGHLLLFLSFKEEETSCLALDTLCFLFQFKRQQHCSKLCPVLAKLLCLTSSSVFPCFLGVTLPEENAQLQEDWEAEVASLTSSSRAPQITKVMSSPLAVASAGVL
ncbi:maestro heat-like repeat-containing protein family member 7 [Patagioenas fasciata]|uniref:maestro heat-like repeat-containing protein family member 7 n=1 Tax=Patagioenas fasciata TaxID=372321 RepID=UPI003A98E95F